MKASIALLIAAFALPLATSVARADMEPQKGTGSAGGWAPRIAVTPDPSKIIVPKGYKVSVFAAGLDTPSAATVALSPVMTRRIASPKLVMPVPPVFGLDQTSRLATLSAFS